MLGSYRAILRIPGAWRFSAAGMVARLPISMLSLGIVLHVSDRTGSYALAGSVAACQVVASASVSPFTARLIDRFGQATVLPLLAAAFGIGVSTLVTVVEADLASPVPHLTAVIAGAALPQIGSNVRARWRHIVGDRSRLDTALAFEAVVDELIFIVGPVLVTFLATQVSPIAGLAATAGCCVSGSLALAVQRSTQPPVGGQEHHSRVREAIGWVRLAPIVGVMVGLGGLFGSAEVVTVAYAEDAGQRDAAGWMLAALAAGSLIAGLITGTLTLRRHPATRVRWGTTALTASVAPLAFLPGIGWIALLLFLAGFAIAPTLVAVISLVERVVPPARLTEGIAWAIAGVGGGIAGGSAIGGAVVDQAGATVGYAVLTGCGTLALTVAWLGLATSPADGSA